jgi:hypothetical protein
MKLKRKGKALIEKQMREDKIRHYIPNEQCLVRSPFLVFFLILILIINVMTRFSPLISFTCAFGL